MLQFADFTPAPLLIPPPRPILLDKRDCIIEKHLPHWIIKYIKCLSYPLPFYTTQKINPFLNSRISANHEKCHNTFKGDCFSNVESLFLIYIGITQPSVKFPILVCIEDMIDLAGATYTGYQGCGAVTIYLAIYLSV